MSDMTRIPSHLNQNSEHLPAGNSDNHNDGFISLSTLSSTSSLLSSKENSKHANQSDKFSRPHYHQMKLGKPISQKAIDSTDLASILGSLICLGAAILVIADESVSWHLGIRNYQLVAVGFLLSIMTICLTSVAPTFFLLVEARFGSSTLQNYEGILRNQILKPHLSLVWRLAFGTILLLPIGLSAAYKTFQGGQSSLSINPADYLGNQSYYGMYPLPGLMSLGRYSGINLFSNATLSFLLATSTVDGVEPPLAEFPKAYGFNHLVLSNESAAILDTPQISYISDVQQMLLAGESWEIEASVLGTIATYNTTNATNPKGYQSDLVNICNDAQDASDGGAYTKLPMFNGYNIVVVDYPSAGNQSLQYVGFTRVTADTTDGDCFAFAPHGQLFGVTRQQCKGRWSISQSNVELLSGSCNGTLAPPEHQLVITDNNLYLGYWYVPNLAELLGAFATTRSQSEWLIPSFASGVASMLWSRVTALDGPAGTIQDTYWAGRNLTSENAGIAYTVEDLVSYLRPTMRKSPLLYLVLIVQPAICIAMVLLKCAFYSTPVGRGFGLISILAGLNTENLEILHGAALSGELKQKVRLVIEPKKSEEEANNAIECRIVLDSVRGKNGRLDRNVMYE